MTSTNIAKLPLKHGDFYLVKNWISLDLFETCKDDIPWKQEQSKVYNKWFDQPRLTCNLSLDGSGSYLYSGQRRKAEKAPEIIQLLVKLVNNTVKLIDPKHPKFNYILCNYYRNGNDKIGKHADDEKDMEPDTMIASLSLGCSRFFDIYPNSSDEEKFRLELEDGDLLFMGKNSQVNYKHAVPPQKKIKEGRINLTLRVMKTANKK